MIPAPTRISSPSITAARFSILSWPYGWSSSAGSPALRTETKATIDAIRSTLEWIASVMIAIEPVIAPATSFSAISRLFERIDSAGRARLATGVAGRAPVTSALASSSAAAARAPRGRGG